MRASSSRRRTPARPATATADAPTLPHRPSHTWAPGPASIPARGPSANTASLPLSLPGPPQGRLPPPRPTPSFPTPDTLYDQSLPSFLPSPPSFRLVVHPSLPLPQPYSSSPLQNLPPIGGLPACPHIPHTPTKANPASCGPPSSRVVRTKPVTTSSVHGPAAPSPEW